MRQILNVVKRTMRRAVKARRIRHDPTAGITVDVPEAEEGPVLDLAQVEALADATTPKRAHLAERSQLPALVRFGYETGRRWGEATGLQARLVTIHIPGTEDLPLDTAVAKYGAEGLVGFEGSHDLSDPRSVLKENGKVRYETGQLKLGQAKNAQSRQVFPLSAEVVALLASHVERFGLGESGLVFTN